MDKVKLQENQLFHVEQVLRLATEPPSTKLCMPQKTSNVLVGLGLASNIARGRQRALRRSRSSPVRVPEQPFLIGILASEPLTDERSIRSGVRRLLGVQPMSNVVMPESLRESKTAGQKGRSRPRPGSVSVTAFCPHTCARGRRTVAHRDEPAPAESRTSQVRRKGDEAQRAVFHVERPAGSHNSPASLLPCRALHTGLRRPSTDPSGVKSGVCRRILFGRQGRFPRILMKRA